MAYHKLTITLTQTRTPHAHTQTERERERVREIHATIFPNQKFHIKHKLWSQGRDKAETFLVLDYSWKLEHKIANFVLTEFSSFFFNLNHTSTSYLLWLLDCKLY